MSSNTVPPGDLPGFTAFDGSDAALDRALADLRRRSLRAVPRDPAQDASEEPAVSARVAALFQQEAMRAEVQRLERRQFAMRFAAGVLVAMLLWIGFELVSAHPHPAASAISAAPR